MHHHRTPGASGRAGGLRRAAKASLAALLSCLLAASPVATSLAEAAEAADDEVVGNLQIVAYTEDQTITDGHSFVVFTSYVDGLELDFTDLYGYYEMTDEYKAACEQDESLLTWRSQFEEAKAEVGSDITLEEYEKTDQFERSDAYPELYNAVYELGDKNFKSVEGEVKDGDERYRQTSYDCVLNSGEYISIGNYNLSSSSRKQTVGDAIANSTLKDELDKIIEDNLTGGHTKDEVIQILAEYLQRYLDGELNEAELTVMALKYLKGVLRGSGVEAFQLLLKNYQNRENLIDGDTKGGIYVNREIWRQKAYQTLCPNQIYSVDITRAQLERMMAYYNDGAESHYSVMTHNCVTVCTGAWNAAVGTDVDGNKTDLYLSGLDDSYKYLDGFFYTVRELRDNITELGEKDAGGTCYEAEVIRGVKLAEPEAETVAMHRLYNPYTGEHLYTASDVERGSLVGLGWNYEGVGWTAPTESSMPVYRLYNPYVAGGDHHYTTSEVEYEALGKQGWSQEGIAWYSDDAQGVPLYRQYNPYAATGTHNYTTSKGENDHLVGLGWNAEGIAWYGVK